MDGCESFLLGKGNENWAPIQKNPPYRFTPYPQQPIGSGSGHLPLAGTRASLAVTDHGLSFMKSSSGQLSFAFLSANCSSNSARICISECTNSPILVSRTFPLNCFSLRIFCPVVLGWVFFFWFLFCFWGLKFRDGSSYGGLLHGLRFGVEDHGIGDR